MLRGLSWEPSGTPGQARGDVKGMDFDTLDQQLFRLELQTGAVDAIAQAVFARPIRENMAKMPLAFRTANLGADHAMRSVAQFLDRIFGQRRGIARPA